MLGTHSTLSESAPGSTAAAHSVCMGSGMEEAKQAAEYVTAPLLEDGVEKAMKHYGLI